MQGCIEYYDFMDSLRQCFYIIIPSTNDDTTMYWILAIEDDEISTIHCQYCTAITCGSSDNRRVDRADIS